MNEAAVQQYVKHAVFFKRARSFAVRATLCVFAAALMPATASANPWVNNYGQVGLGQTPTARSLGEGGLAFGYAKFDPYRNYTLHAQPLPWLQGTFRFTDIRNRKFAISTTGETTTDKGFDLQFRLMEESDLVPEVALGLMDFGGTGAFASEYVVASKRYYDFDFTVGLGWGRLGSSADFSNPVGILVDSFDERPRGFEGGFENSGQLEAETWFRGDMAVFGGVVWTPDRGLLSLYAEVEGNDYQSERGPNLPADSRLNVGANLRVLGALDLGVSFQRGRELVFSAHTHGRFDQEPEKPHGLGAGPYPVRAYTTAQLRPTSKRIDPATVERITRELSPQGIFVHAMDDGGDGRRLTIWFGQGLSDSLAPAAGRIARSVIRYTGRAYDEYALVDLTGGMESARFVLPRAVFHRAIAGDASVEEFLSYVYVEQPRRQGYAGADYNKLLAYPAFKYSFSPQVRTNIGGPDQFAVGQVLLRGAGTLQLTKGWSFTGALAFNVFENVGSRLGTRFPSGLPRVRSDIGLYQRTGKDYYLAQLETNYLFPIMSDVYGRVSAGIFEEMYGGVAGEVLYRPTGERWAVGVDLNRVRQRDFDQRFTFRDYEVTTGHLTYYHELPWNNIRAIVSAGQYLAGDRGMTFDFSRGFRSGARFGVFASFTNVSSKQFGEGSFDKGFYITIPLDFFSPRSAKGATTFGFRPLVRDGGQKVTAGRALYDTLQFSHTRTLRNDPEAWLR